MSTKTYAYKKVDGDNTKRAKLTDITETLANGGSSTTPETPSELTFGISTNELQVYRYNSTGTSGINISSDILGTNKTFTNDADILYLGTINGDTPLTNNFGLDSNRFTITSGAEGDAITSNSSIVGVYYLLYKMK